MQTADFIFYHIISLAMRAKNCYDIYIKKGRFFDKTLKTTAALRFCVHLFQKGDNN